MTTTQTGRVIPVLDISQLRAGPGPRAALLDELRAAAHDIGFFAVVGHGIPDDAAEGVLSAAREFFALPLPDRLAIENVNSPQFRGYTRVGAEVTAGVADQRDQLDIGPEREALALGPGDPPYLRLIGPNQWPTAVAALRPAVLRWLAEADRAAREVLRALAAALGQSEEYFDTWFDSEASVSLKVVRYPGGGGGPSAGPRQGVGAHKDYGYLAFVLQDEVGGLQVEVEPGRWLDVPPVPGALVCNIGEMLEVATRGYLRATVHRVVSPPSDVDRYSVPFFLGPRLDAVVEPIPLPPELADRARGVSDDPDNPLLAAYGEKALIGWLRSHPRVARRWWSDVLATRPDLPQPPQGADGNGDR
ncbi:isopenicillin N synthase family oxygenase [Dactylosporangium vinaceum]|uniref:Isopenicillin N synthase family dioxygenase n=1 Tax=Dactylosporangium vinaceum TaxID=53362 RepID=A0ABV5M330_9ACTN|nr:2-oxoglutarate and iron-dependent oxygenase domain-containing protein [Dactylosporangium vinaceum]UAB99797.1 isopenicillin N synthase family oxygenase [Dactylosporangium vinaceum]